MDRPRIIIGMTGASGIAIGIRILERLRDAGSHEVHLVMSKAAEITLAHETDRKLAEIHALADVNHAFMDIAAAPSSGSFRTIGMLVAPCSMRSLAEIATGATSSLLTRAADVVMKERRRLVLMVRETPLHSGHLRNMLTLSDMGAIIAPPVPAYYNRPASVDAIIEQSAGRMLDLFGIDSGCFQRWGE